MLIIGTRGPYVTHAANGARATNGECAADGGRAVDGTCGAHGASGGVHECPTGG
jgi:hypothetical protein